jgi:hypothetical protein
MANNPSAPSPFVWFLLLDSATGLPYKGTGADKVAVYSSADVADFRKAVKAEHSNKLSSVDAADLLVYKNKAAFNNRNTTVDEGMEEPLEEDSFINGYGASKKEALVVVVPQPILPSQTQPLFYPPCDVAFYNSVCDVIENDGWIWFGHDIPSTSLKKLYVRESYRTIASSIKPGINKAIISGTPGIGKSLFLIYLLWKLVTERKRVLFIYNPYIIYYDGHGGVFWFSSRQLPLDNDTSFWNDTLWCLFDCKEKVRASLAEVPYALCTFILSTSPRREMVNDFKKPPVPQVFYMPTWTEAELEMIAPSFPGVANWKERFRVLGGIPRHVLEITTDNPIKLLEKACKQCDIIDCIKIIGRDNEITDKSKVIHSLVHIITSNPFTECSVYYASKTAMDIIIANNNIGAKLKMSHLLQSCEGNPLMASLCGYIFEPFAIELLEKGGTFKCRELVQGTKKVKPDETKVDIPSSIKKVVSKVAPNQTRNTLHVPKTTNYTAIDAWIPGIGAFQMTVGKTHGIKGGARNDLAMLGHESNKLYWLLPPLYYHSFTKKSPQDIEQYAVLIPYPE